MWSIEGQLIQPYTLKQQICTQITAFFAFLDNEMAQRVEKLYLIIILVVILGVATYLIPRIRENIKMAGVKDSLQKAIMNAPIISYIVRGQLRKGKED